MWENVYVKSLSISFLAYIFNQQNFNQLNISSVIKWDSARIFASPLSKSFNCKANICVLPLNTLLLLVKCSMVLQMRNIVNKCR